MQSHAATPLPLAASRARARRSQPPARALLGPLRAGVGGAAVLTVLGCCFVLAAGTSARATGEVPASHGGFPGWLSGPLHGLGIGLGLGGFQTLELVMFGAWLLALAGADALPLRFVLAGVVLADLCIVLGPVILSQDAFGYVSFARLGILHGLDPYTHTSAAVPLDPAYPYLGWHNVHSPYGPLFTLGSYVLVPLGVAGAIWALKLIAAVAAALATAIVALAARRSDRPAGFAAAFVGLNPVLLTFAVGGAHNDLLLVLLTAAAALAVASGRPGGAAATTVAAAAIKVSSGLLLPFLLLSRELAGRRREALLAALLTAAAVAIVAVIAFGPHALGFVDALRGQQQRVTQFSVPAQFTRVFGVHGFPGWWRDLFDGMVIVVTLVGLALTWRGADWRTAAGWSMLALVCSTAWVLSWYILWVLPLAALSRDRLLRGATIVVSAYLILYHLPLGHHIGLSRPAPQRPAATLVRRASTTARGPGGIPVLESPRSGRGERSGAARTGHARAG